MTNTLPSLDTFTDRDLLTQLERAVRHERQATAQVIALLTEVDARRLYAQQSCSSLFTYCVQVLHLSEHAAYLRIEAARAARRFPAILGRLEQGSLHLTAVSLLAPHLTAANHVEVLDAAEHKSKRDVEQLVARLRPRPDAPAVVRKLPAPRPEAVVAARTAIIEQPVAVTEPTAGQSVLAPAHRADPIRPPEIKPLAPERFKVQFTVGRDTYEKLRHAQDLMRHTIPNGDAAAIFDKALTLLLVELAKSKCAATGRARSAGRTGKAGARHVAAAVKREVWRRDEGRCAFRGERGRCAETGFLEFHHVLPYARGGATTAENLELRCRAHNRYEAEQQYGSQMPSFWARKSL